MSILGALFTGVSGLSAESQAMGIISDNIANANTTAYKDTEAQFSTLVTQIPTNTLYQPGGVIVHPSTMIDQQGLLTATSSSTDLALSGGGFFVVNSTAADTGAFSFTRAGAFTIDANGNLKNSAGFFLQGQKLTAAQSAHRCRQQLAAHRHHAQLARHGERQRPQRHGEGDAERYPRRQPAGHRHRGVSPACHHRAGVRLARHRA
jgi:flagellar hook-basal body protein